MKHRTFSILMLLALLLVSVVPLTAQDATYPVTIEHKFGSITLEQRPERIVSIGYTEQDPLYALGANPVAIRYWYGDPDDAVFPWAEDEAGDADPVVLNMPYGNLNYEAILALEPDLISAIGSGITEDEYETLSQIAPVLAQSGDYVDFGSPWQVTTRTIGRALGLEAEAEALVTDLEEQFVEVREQNPQFQEAAVAVAYHGRGTYGYYTAQDGRGRFFTDLGFVVPERLNEIAGDSFYADISEERVDLLDQDLLVFLGLQFAEDGSEAAREFIESDLLIQQLDAVQDGRVLYIADEYDDALQFTTILSLEFLLENLVPEIAEVLPAENDNMETTTEVSANECENGFRLFDHELLATDPVCIPENPERIVAAWPFNITALLRADAPIVGMIDQEFVIGQFPEWEAELAEITDLGRPLNLELMLTLEPDLIIAPSFLAENPNTLTAIAPTVLFEWEGTHIWREVTELMFDAAGEREAFEAILTEQDSRIAELSGLLGDATTQELSLVNVRSDSVFLYTQYSPGGMIAEELGFARPEAQLLPVTPDELADNPDAYPNFAPYFAPYLQEISLELINRAAGDFIIVFGDFNTDDEAQTYLDEVTENPLWQTLDAVQAGDVFVSAVNYAGGGIWNAHFFLDDIAEAFCVAEGLSPNPYEIKAPLPEMTTEESSN